jgi:hypothetical protein
MKGSWQRQWLSWLAVVALLSNALLPPGLVIAVAGQSAASNTFRSGLCSASPGRDSPGKAKPAPLAHHCALCAPAPDVLTPDRQAAVLRSPILSAAAFPSHPTTAPSTPFRNFWTQPRAPPAIA